MLNPWVVARREPGGLVPTGVAGNSAGLAVANGRVGGMESSQVVVKTSVVAMLDPAGRAPTEVFASADTFRSSTTYQFAYADTFRSTTTYPFGSADPVR